jgi:hypothetical protein
MTTQQLTGSDLREAVFEIISRELGPAVLVRYIAENFSQPGRDYTEERRALPHDSVENIVGELQARKTARGGTLAPASANEVGAPPQSRRKSGRKP